MRRIDGILSGDSRSTASSLARGCLWFASQPYAIVVQIRNWMYDRGWIESHAAPIPVVSVGNLTAGGTGKTPACAYLAKWFRGQGVRVAILSRGYGELEDGTNDEARELELQLPDVPHLQSPDRVAMARLAHEELDMQLLLLDDGFQHRKLRRDLDVVLIDATEPFGYGFMLPRGLMREPIRSLRRADVVIATRADHVDAKRLAEIRTLVQRYSPRAAWIEGEHAGVELIDCEGATRPIEWLCGRSVVALSGIGNPLGFEASLRRYGATIVEHVTYPDHHPYSRQDVAAIEQRLAEHASTPTAVICTGKDLAKLAVPKVGGLELWALRVEMRIRSGGDILNEHLERMLALTRSQ
jgi:tetraacyldisaccharide 4'-kinase